MLIEFSVSNYRSFREKQTFSMVAAPRLGKTGNVFKPTVVGESLPGLLKVAAIYGPNASGKSNLVSAMAVAYRMIMRSAAEAGPLPISPFRFDPGLAQEPSRFEFHFVEDGLRYQFTLAATAERIVEEVLTCYPKGKEALLYSRVFQSGKEAYEFGKKLEGGSIVHTAWKNLTGPQTLFLTQAVVNSSENLQQLRKPYRWLQSTSNSIQQDSMGKWADFSKTMLKHNHDLIEHLQTFLQAVVIPITHIRLKPIDASVSVDPEQNFAEQRKSIQENYKALLTHKTALGEAEFDFAEESGGTRNLMGFWGPWALLQSVPGAVLIVDELNSSLHPKIVESLVASHIASELKSQLIFTTHDTHLMNTQLLRRDQFWITERDQNGATALLSVHDFQGRDSENVEKRYYEGRYRGLPIMRG